MSKRHALIRTSSAVGALALALACAGLTPASHAAGDIAPGDAKHSFDAVPATLGAIPDSTVACSPGNADPRVAGAPLDIAFEVDMPVGDITNVSVSFTVNPLHPAVGELTAQLIAPGDQSASVLDHTGSGKCGDYSDLQGEYTFNDQATGDLDSAAAAAGTEEVIAPGAYFPFQANGDQVSLTDPFKGIANPNGRWILRITDSGMTESSGSSSTLPLPLPIPLPLPLPLPFPGADTSPAISAASLSIWTGDRAPADPAPDTKIRRGPANGSTIAKGSTATFRFSSPDSDVTAYSCKVNKAKWANCTSPWKRTFKKAGEFTVKIRAVDAAGHVDPTPATRQFSVVPLACGKAAKCKNPNT